MQSDKNMDLQLSSISSAANNEVRSCQNGNCEAPIVGVRVMQGYLFPRFCHECTDKLVAEEKKQERERILAEAAERLNLPPRFANSTFENFKQELQPTAYRAASTFANAYTHSTNRGLYLFGKAGSGKTHLAAAIGNHLMLNHGVRFITAPELLLNIRKAYAAGSRADEGLLDSLSQTKLLIIDDLGSEKPTEWVQETMFVLIDRRYTHYLPTVITSNFSLDQLKERLGYRIASRIAEVSEMVELQPSDYRIRKQ